MAYTPIRMCQGVLLAAGATLYTATGNGVVCRQIRLANPSASDVTVTVALIPSGGSGDPTHVVIGGSTVPANGSYEFNAWQVLNAGDTLHASAGTDSVVVLTASGLGLG